MRPRLLIVDDHKLYRQRLAAAAVAEGLDVIGECGNGEEAMSLVAQERPDVVVVDLSLGGSVHGLELARMILDVLPRATVVACGGFTDPGSLQRAFRAGVHRCLRKPFRAEDAQRLFENLMAEIEPAGRS